MRPPQEIIGDDRYQQLVFEGYAVVPATPSEAMRRAGKEMMPVEHETRLNDNKPEQAWHPIASAPKDKMVLIWHQGTRDYSLAWFDTPRGRWVLESDPDYNGPNHLRPTLWHPLPEPPSKN